MPHTALAPDLLRAVIESFMLREGTDYGERELSLDDKVGRVVRLLERGDARIVFDPRTESVDVGDQGATCLARARIRSSSPAMKRDSTAKAGSLPWTSWREALAREMAFYQSCPSDRGYPRFAYVTFLDAEWKPHADRTDTIPATQSGMGIISYLKYARLRPESTGSSSDGRARPRATTWCRRRITPDEGRYPSFTRSTGKRDLISAACRIAARKATGRSRSSPTRAASRATHCSLLV